MASGRGPGDDVRRELGQIWQSALGQIDEIRDAIVKGGHAGKARLELELARRRREQAYAELGHALFAELEAGSLTLSPASSAVLDKVREADREVQLLEKAEREPSGDGSP